MKDGLIDRDDLDRKQDTALSPAEHLLVKPGDIAYNTMRMWQGAFGLSDREGMVSPAYVVLKPKTNVDSAFLAQLLGTPRMRHLLWAYSYGLTDDRLRLYFDDFAAIPVVIPRLEVQQRIVRILSTYDQAINATHRLLDNSLRQQKALLSMLTSGDKSAKTSPHMWSRHSLGSLGATYGGLSGKSAEDFGKGSRYIPYNNIFKNCRIDINDLKLVLVDGDECQNKTRFGDIFFTISSETPEEVGMASVLLDEVDDLYLNSFCFGYRLNDFNTLIPQYAAYALRSPKIRSQMAVLAQGSTRFNISKPNVMRLEVELPSIDEQLSIVEILDVGQKTVEGISKEILKLRSMKSALMATLLSRNSHVKLSDAQVEAQA